MEQTVRLGAWGSLVLKRPVRWEELARKNKPAAGERGSVDETGNPKQTERPEGQDY